MSAVLPLEEAVAWSVDPIRIRARIIDHTEGGRTEGWIEFSASHGVFARRRRTRADEDAVFGAAFSEPVRVLLAAYVQRNGRVRAVIAAQRGGRTPQGLSDLVDAGCVHVIQSFETDLLELPAGEPLASVAREWLERRVRVPVADGVSDAIARLLDGSQP